MRTTPGARNFVGSLRFDGLTQTLQQPLQRNLIPARGMTVQALSGISKVEDDAETAIMHRVALQALRLLP